MARIARPSDVYRLPEQSPVAPRPVEPPDLPPRRRVPVWVWVAAVVAIGLVASGLSGSAGSAPPTVGDAPLVDIISEDQAIAALALYGAEATAIADLRGRRDIYAGGGPAAANVVAQRGVANVQRTLDAVREVPNPDPLLTAYAGSADHAATLVRLSVANTVAGQIRLLAATHDSIYSGSGAIGFEEAATQINGALSGGRTAAPLERWGIALLEQLEDRPRLDAALAGREESAQHWAALVDALEPGAVAELQTYISGLPADTVAALRGHPVAGPALQTLEESSRKVSTGTTSPSGRH